MANPKIIVVKLKQLIYTLLSIALGILIIVILILLLSNHSNDASATPTGTPNAQAEGAAYIAGVYSSVIALGDATLNLEVIVDDNHINSVRIDNIDTAVATMYPLVEPSLALLEEQLVNEIPLDDIVFTEDSKYTQSLLLDAIRATLEKAAAPAE